MQHTHHGILHHNFRFTGELSSTQFKLTRRRFWMLFGENFSVSFVTLLKGMIELIENADILLEERYFGTMK